MDAIVRAKPTGAKGKFVKKVCAQSSTMGPGVKVDLDRDRRRLSLFSPRGPHTFAGRYLPFVETQLSRRLPRY